MIIYSTDSDEAINPNDRLFITAKLNLNNIITKENGKYIVHIYRKQERKVVELEVNNIEICWMLDGIKELAKTNMNQFSKILIKQYD